jgi:hypothetical protein
MPGALGIAAAKTLLFKPNKNMLTDTVNNLFLISLRPFLI